MSGGVDSSTAAALLLEQGVGVVGLTLKVWDRSRCCSVDDVEDARRVARHLGIPFYVLDAHEAFEHEVVGPFARGYAEGGTPNPCIRCNRRVKFRWLLRRALALGCEALATGHYARVEARAGRVRLRKGVDPAKDQSYFLVPEDPADLSRVRFPLGSLTKGQVREAAERLGLPVARKGESQDVCFLPEGGLERFLAERLGPGAPGEIVDRSGRLLGRHRGVAAYTVGQRRGLGVSVGEPVYVIEKDVARNRLVVGPRQALLAPGLVARDAVWMEGRPPGERFRCAVKIRSTAPEVPCEVRVEGGRVRVRFDSPRFGVAPGQMAVFYRGDEVLGGAWIEQGLGPPDGGEPAP